jgi:FdrA protein
MIALNRIRRAFYMDSAALMRLSQAIGERSGIVQAALMIGSPSNKRLMAGAGLLAELGELAGANDLVIAVSAEDEAVGEAALAEAEALLDRPPATEGTAGGYRPRSLAAAIAMLEGANLALISVPGEFAAEEALKALRHGLHVMIFSDNVPLAEEKTLKGEARARGLLLMGPDCGSAIISGAPLGFANAVPRGAIGIIAASGTGLQEVACLIARAGAGISHAIGVGGRDLSPEIGGLTTLAAIDALDDDPATAAIVIISKPPGGEVARRVLERVGRSRKPFTICFLGLDFLGPEAAALPANARAALTLRDAAELALGGGTGAGPVRPGQRATGAARRRWIRGLYSGGTLCAEAQIVLRQAGEHSFSNAPIPGGETLPDGDVAGHSLVDLGADEYTRGRPHAIIDPAMRLPHLTKALADPNAAAVLLDVVLGYGAHRDPAATIIAAIAAAPRDRPTVIASVCGTAGDPQIYAAQVARLVETGVVVAPSNAAAAEHAISLLRR